MILLDIFYIKEYSSIAFVFIYSPARPRGTGLGPYFILIYSNFLLQTYFTLNPVDASPSMRLELRVTTGKSASELASAVPPFEPYITRAPTVPESTLRTMKPQLLELVKTQREATQYVVPVPFGIIKL